MAQHHPLPPTVRSPAPRPQSFLPPTEPTPITVELLGAADTSNPDSYYDEIVEAMNEGARRYAVTTPLRVAHFLSQIGHESRFRATEENGNYTAKRMHEIFGCQGGSARYDSARDDCDLGADGQPMRRRPKLWTEQDSYAGNPQGLLSYVYADRLGNGDEASGDGFRYRGRGLIQLTGKTNYGTFTTAHNARDPADPQDFVAFPDLLLRELKYAIESAFYFWDARTVNDPADADDLEEVTTRVNGGLNGLKDRGARLARVKHILGI